MKLVISEEALTYVTSKGETILTLDLLTAGNSCVPVSEPHVHLGKPKDPLYKYDLLEQSGLKIYVYKGAQAKQGVVRIHLKRFLGIKSLEAEGIQLL